MSEIFEVTTHAKWILAGEHAVLRGHPALVFPVMNRSLTLRYEEDHQALEADFEAPFGDTLLLFFWGLLRTGLKRVQKKERDLTGRFFLSNNIPMGYGMGFSAALCVAVSKWFVWKGWLPSEGIFNFARQLENNFHGKSSGVDILGAMTDSGMFYHMNGEMTPVQCQWSPNLYLTYSDQISATAKCIEKVQTLWQQDQHMAETIDRDMAKSVHLAKEALGKNATEGFPLLRDAIKLAQHCFSRWGLVSENVGTVIRELVSQGAVAAKPTGSGDGGYVLSLWPEEPRIHYRNELIPVF